MPDEPTLEAPYVEPNMGGNGADPLFDAGSDDSPFAETIPLGPEDDDRRAEKAPQPVKAGPRTPLTDLVSFAWGGAGMALANSNDLRNLPVGRVLQFQAPIAGQRIDALIAGTWVDTFLQPLAKQADKVEGVGALFLFPILVGAYVRNPGTAPVVEPILRQIVQATLVDMAPVLKKQAERERKAAQAIADVTQAFDIGKDEDPVDAVLAMIFAPPPGEPEPEAAPE